MARYAENELCRFSLLFYFICIYKHLVSLGPMTSSSTFLIVVFEMWMNAIPCGMLTIWRGIGFMMVWAFLACNQVVIFEIIVWLDAALISVHFFFEVLDLSKFESNSFGVVLIRFSKFSPFYFIKNIIAMRMGHSKNFSALHLVFRMLSVGKSAWIPLWISHWHWDHSGYLSPLMISGIVFDICLMI